VTDEESRATRLATEVELRAMIRRCQELSAWCYSRLREPVWKSQDGSVRPIAHMSDEHLRNALRVVQRRGEDPDGAPVLVHLQREFERRRRGGFR
jgi:hypothetical protein